MGVDYYKILGITKNANELDIKNAYRKLSMRYHPSKNTEAGTEDTFKQLNEAYSVLSDAQKRAVYDKYGEEGLKNNFKIEVNVDEIFEKFFGTLNPFAANTGEPFDMNGIFGGKPSGPQKGTPVHKSISVSLEDFYSGVTKKVKITKQVLTGDGKITQPESKILLIQVKPGWRKGTKVTFNNEGDEGPGITPGDVVFTVVEKPHERYKREDDDLYITSDISLEKALIGTQLKIETLDGRTLPIPINDIVTPQYVKVVPGEGMPNPKTGQKGNLHIKFNILFPSSLNSSQKQLVKQVFNPPSSSPSPSSN